MLVFPLRRRQPRPNLRAKPPHRPREILSTLPSIKQLVRNRQCRQDGCLLSLHDIAGPHRLTNDLIDVLGYGSRALGTGIAADRVLVAEDRHSDDILFRAQRAGAPSCCCRRNRTRSIICWVRVRAASSRLLSPAFSRSRCWTRSGETTPLTPVDSRDLSRASACSARRRKEASSSPRCFTSCSSSANAVLSGRALSDTQFSLEGLHNFRGAFLDFFVL